MAIIIPLNIYCQELPNVIHTDPGQIAFQNHPNIMNPNDLRRLKSLLKTSDRIQWQYPDSAMDILNRVFHESLLAGNFDLASTAKTNMGLVAMGKGNFDSSFRLYKEAVFYIRKSINEKKLMSTLFINVGATYFYQNNYEKALEYYYAILQYMLKVNQKDPNLIMAYSNIADVLIHMEQYDKASYYLNLGEELIHKLQAYGPAAFVWVNKAEIALLQKDYPTALSYCDKSLEMAVKYKEPEAEQGVYIIKARYCLAQQETEKAISYLNKALQANASAYTYYSVISPYYTLGTAYYQAGDYKNAEKALRKALVKATNTGVLSDKVLALQTLASVYEKTGQYKAALEQQNEVNILRDSIQNREKLKIANELETKFRTAQKDKDIAKKELLIAKQKSDLEYKNVQMLSIGAGLAIFLIIAAALYWNFKNKSRITALKANMDGEEKERGRIARELHDGIGGMLAVIKMRVSSGGENVQEEVVAYLNETSEQVRITAHNLMPDVVSDFTLPEALTMYAETMNRAYDTLHIDMQIHSELNIADHSAKLSIYRMLQEIIQNIITHANATIAVIQIFEQNGKLHLLIEDNGIGFDYKKVKKGIGLINLEARVKILNGNIHFSSSPGMGTTINIEFSS